MSMASLGVKVKTNAELVSAFVERFAFDLSRQCQSNA